MKTPKKNLAKIFEAVLFIGLVVGLVFAIQFIRVNFLPSNASGGAQPLPAATQVQKLLPTEMPSPTQAPTLIVLDNGWYLYTDPDGAFSFAYPADAVIAAGQNPVDLSKNITLQFNLPGKGYQGMSIRLAANPKRLPGSDIAVQIYEDVSQKSAPAGFASSVEPFSVAGLAAARASIPATNTEVTVIVPYNDLVLILAPVHDSATTHVDEETLALFYQVIDSFKFNPSK